MNIDKPYHNFAEVLESEAISQFESAMQQPFVVQGALMPDAHAGYSLPIGAVVATKDVIVPAWVGYDIGCGMCALPTSFDVELVRQKSKFIFNDIYAEIPVGFNHNNVDTVWEKEWELPRTDALQELFNKNGLKQLGSLGGGNHFIEIGYDSNNMVWVIIHSGSRGLGHDVAKHHMIVASGTGKASEGHFGFDVNSKEGEDYINDMNFCLAFALRNRQEMMERVINILTRHCCRKHDDGTTVNEIGFWDTLINRNHNHAEFRDGVWIHRKGATHADDGMMGVIPGNMRDGSFIVRGLGNPLSLYSSSHGAGRVLGRKQAQKTLNMDDFKNTMQGITALVLTNTLDESPFAYKDIFDVMRLQSGLVEVVTHVRPIINIKG